MINGLTRVYSEECPEVTLDNVISTFQHLHASKNETFVTGIIDVFRKLSRDYKTNNPCRLGKKNYPRRCFIHKYLAKPIRFGQD
uniref:Z1226 protein n=1 Tax=Klebsiella pneumoniae TaxID=573 RepID=A0A8B0SUT5_KLEPN|nr:Z1226 protein [Klebsiella pneumoniae]